MLPLICAAHSDYPHIRIIPLIKKAGELGRAKKKATHYFELAAMKGDVDARVKLGANEYQSGNHHRAFKHFKLAARVRHANTLKLFKHGYTVGHVTKEDYAIVIPKESR